MRGKPVAFAPGNGDVDARCLVIATAPGDEGTVLTGVPLQGDHAGDNFEKLIAAAGMRRESLYITDALLCPLTDESGRARRPLAGEIRRCARFISSLVVTLDPKLVVTLGTTALRALHALAPHEVVLSRDVGRPVRWMARWLLPLYHPGPRAMIHRSWAQQLHDYARWRALL